MWNSQILLERFSRKLGPQSWVPLKLCLKAGWPRKLVWQPKFSLQAGLWTKMDLESWKRCCIMAKSITSPTKLNSGSTRKLVPRKLDTQKAGTSSPKSWVREAGIWLERPRKLGVCVVGAPRKLGWTPAAPRKLDVPVSYLFRRQKLGLTIWAFTLINLEEHTEVHIRKLHYEM